MRTPQVVTLRYLFLQGIKNSNNVNGQWIPHRVPYTDRGINIKKRLKCAWMVLIGKGDVLLWD